MQNKITQYLQTVNKLIEAFNNFDTKNLNDFMTNNLEFKNISHGEVIEMSSSLVEFTLSLEQSKALFSKRIFQIENLNINNNNIEATIICNAKMAISTIDGLRAGQEIFFKGSLNITIVENKITKIVQIS